MKVIPNITRVIDDVSKWKPSEEELDIITYMASLGFSEKQIANKMNIEQSVFRWVRQNNPMINKAIDDGLNSTIQLAAEKLLDKIEKGDLNAIIFFLSRKGGWVIEQNVNVSSKKSFKPLLKKISVNGN